MPELTAATCLPIIEVDFNWLRDNGRCVHTVFPKWHPWASLGIGADVIVRDGDGLQFSGTVDAYFDDCANRDFIAVDIEFDRDTRSGEPDA